MCKSFFKLNWKVFIEEIVKELGYRSENALKYALSCSDHHKTWSICEIILLALTDELLYPYVKKSICTGEEITVDGYWKWSTSVINPNYIYVPQMSLTFLQAKMLFRVGVRRNDYKSILVY